MKVFLTAFLLEVVAKIHLTHASYTTAHQLYPNSQNVKGKPPNASDVPVTHRRKLPKNGGGGGGPKTASCKITNEKIGIYTGEGICSTCSMWAEAFVSFWKSGTIAPESTEALNEGRVTFEGDPAVTYVSLTTSEIENCYNGELNTLELFIMPGGSAYEIQLALGEAGKNAITTYLDQGGSYLGICAGGYYLAKGYFWKGYDGAPADNCDEKFCLYELSGTYSYSSTSQDFSIHEWGGTSYHSNLVAYGPLSDVILEGPIEEIAGPWALESNPNAPYDSHLVEVEDEGVPSLRQIYYGGSTENYIYTNSSSNSWGEELAYFVSNPSNDGDHDFPSDLWTLKKAATGNGNGHIFISSAHIEASIHHTLVGDGGMTECQNYNNYVYLARVLGSSLGQLGLVVPEYDLGCSSDRAVGGASKDTLALFPQGLAYSNAPRINSGGGGGVCGSGKTVVASIDFENGDLVGNLSGSAQRPWAIDSKAACDGSNHGITAGRSADGDRGVDAESILIISIPNGASSMSFFYSYPNALDAGDDFHVYLNDVEVRSYEIGEGAICATDCVDVSAGGVVKFKCKSSGNNEICSLDQICFYG